MDQVAGSLSNGIETLSHVFRLVDAFRAFNADNDGHITTAQLGGIMASLGYNPSEQDLKVMMQRGDTDRDSLLSIEEFLEMNTDELGLGSLATHLRSAFKALDLKGDRDKDEYVTGEELYAVTRDIEVNLSLECCEEIIAMDGDGDGAVSIEDFKLIVNTFLS